MNRPISLDTARQQLADAISKFQPPIPAPLNISPWVAMALLQKAIRRGREDFALRAAATLLKISPERLWRRCGGITFEDIGLADIETLAIVVAALAGKRYRATLGGEWPVASFIVARMVHAPKCRAADDLLMSAELHPAFEHVRNEFAHKTTPELLGIAGSSMPLHERAIALWYALGTDRRHSRHLHPRSGEPQAAFDTLIQIGCPGDLVEISREGFRKVGEVLCPFVSLLYPLRQTETAVVEDDEFPPEAKIGDVPGWVYDIYSREGRGALQEFLRGESATARRVRAHVPSPERVNFLGGVLFRAEGGLVRKRMRWATADELRRLVDLECQGPHCPDATDILRLMRADIGQLNAVRAHVC